jgi:putative ABC transport system permease protein
LISLLFLLVCSVNLIGILLGKFVARAPEIGVRRALGASRAQIFLQHIIECELIGVIGGVLGLGLTVLGLRWVDSLFTMKFGFAIDWSMFAVALVLASLASVIAGIYPAWRICRIEPAVHLKTQ